jgi:hypothetical protein
MVSFKKLFEETSVHCVYVRVYRQPFCDIVTLGVLLLLLLIINQKSLRFTGDFALQTLCSFYNFQFFQNLILILWQAQAYPCDPLNIYTKTL